ncbi:hypothetical protein N2599_29645 (plasmid) [Rhizobium sullae]|uniref:Uncharacterized protein n=1 Tax=Rhizobium sullae TaxID=50338 RepID=A0ABY5XSW6_RHISU|nr:hypothetical protein [Rhizobium sullae]UWU16973.1 hypothetical protein N2599_29645 [Rhizobium sullae]
MDATSAERLIKAMVHDKTQNLLRIVEEVCRRYPPIEDLEFIRYLLGMIVHATDDGNDEDRH